MVFDNTLNSHFGGLKVLESEIILQLNPTFPLKKEDENKIKIYNPQIDFYYVFLLVLEFGDLGFISIIVLLVHTLSSHLQRNNVEYKHFLLQVLQFHRADVSDQEIRLGKLNRLALINPRSWNKFLAWRERNDISSRLSVSCVDNSLPVHVRIRWVLKLFWGSPEVAIFSYNSCLVYPSLVIRKQQM